MATQVKLWTLESDFAMPQYYGKLKVFEEETYASLRVRLEEKLALEWPFEFWDHDDNCRIHEKMEGLNDVVGDVYVLPQ
jgi:hypothetical protein